MVIQIQDKAIFAFAIAFFLITKPQETYRRYTLLMYRWNRSLVRLRPW